jgi:molybdopterin converting factor small subunit
MTIRVEFFGIARQRTAVAACDCECTAAGRTLTDLLRELGIRFPAFAAEVLRDGQLRQEFIANRNSDEFLRDGGAVISAGETILILSTDAGG